MTETTNLGNIIMIPPLRIKTQSMNNSKTARSLSTQMPKMLEKKLEEYKTNDCLPDKLSESYNVRISDSAINNINIYNDESIELSRNTVTPFDCAVMDSIYTIINSGVRVTIQNKHANKREELMVVTEDWIAKVMAGDMDYRSTPQRREQIRESIDKLRCIFIKIRCQQEIEARGDKKNTKKYEYSGFLLPLEILEASENQKIKFASNSKESERIYIVLSKPALYSYAERIHQIVTFPAEYLETKDCNFKDTEFSIPIKRYVVKRVEQIKHQNKLKSNKISFEWYDGGEIKGLYAELGIKPDNSDKWAKKTKPLISKIVRETLGSLKTKGVITGYKPYRANGTDNKWLPIMGYEIFWK